MDNGKFAARNADGVKQEKLGVRPTDYSEWHRTLGAEYTAHDLDFIEVRRNEGIVGLFSVTGNLNDESHIENSKKYIYQRTSFQMEIRSMRELCEGKRFKAYYVLYTKDLSLFEVWNVVDHTEPTWQKMSKEDYAEFIKGLHKPENN